MVSFTELVVGDHPEVQLPFIIGSKFMKFEAATPSLKPVQTNSFSFNYKLEPVGGHHPDGQLPD